MVIPPRLHDSFRSLLSLPSRKDECLEVLLGSNSHQMALSTHHGCTLSGFVVSLFSSFSASYYRKSSQRQGVEVRYEESLGFCRLAPLLLPHVQG